MDQVFPALKIVDGRSAILAGASWRGKFLGYESSCGVPGMGLFMEPEPLVLLCCARSLELVGWVFLEQWVDIFF